MNEFLYQEICPRLSTFGPTPLSYAGCGENRQSPLHYGEPSRVNSASGLTLGHCLKELC